ncbi:hypothetical protein [Actinoalloteichus fjordicus]|uniref:Uncharacterized protein n=1 Tax=Actinoalloteichus fjordicus TaxID=1612552 RepID=A0AAC9PPP5_9PSEU|nr:hypothetical protein [Actinoalloteichus fjordicus]APU12274.1 hypothetical protein UA74_00905 [Actinoalloteichus fjordicus]
MRDQSFDLRTCGRPTRSGRPCRSRLHGYDLACGIHADEHDRALAAAYGRGWREGFSAGQDSGSRSMKGVVERLRQDLAESRRRLDGGRRSRQAQGHQIVEVGGYAYCWRGTPALKLGDRVLLPENHVSRLKYGPGPFEGVVSALDSSYEGELGDILRRSVGL